jgi:hypothetical protein
MKPPLEKTPGIRWRGETATRATPETAALRPPTAEESARASLQKIAKAEADSAAALAADRSGGFVGLFRRLFK